MRFRVFGVRLAFVICLACLVLLLQMLAVSQLSSSQNRGLEIELEAQGTLQSPSLHNKRPLENQARPLENQARPLENQARPPVPKAPDNEWDNKVRIVRDRVVRHMQQLQNNSQSQPNPQQNADRNKPSLVWRGKTTATEAATTVKAAPSVGQTNYGSEKRFPVPPQHRNCNINGKKDALSAISRASSQECKDLLLNVTCAQMAGFLYDTDIRRECPSQNPSRNFRAVPLDPSGVGARVVFLLSLHGRAVRQVKRLFKAVYHTDHYYFIHVDSRSDYLHRNLYEAFSDYPNIYFPTWRIATIWGGASLLQMLLRALEDLEFILTSWKWDYFINLSESDYPLKTNTELVSFLKAHEGENFVKTHGADIKKFIQKQGLDRTFVECDNHMWRVDNRRLPGDITIDGGSDWIAIHRNYSRYLVTGRSNFLTGLKRYYEFSLLPAESFFHTVLRNGPMCDTFVRTNLRITNWNRKLGCRCQYKHIVDWCGCSPNDFLTKDLGRLQNPGDHNFFARKFEAIVNHDVINKLDYHLFGVLPDDTPAVTSFWENVYHVEDDTSFPYGAKYSTYQSFLRLGLTRLYGESKTVAAVDENCAVPRQTVVKEVSVLMVSDRFKGLIVTLKDGMSASLTPPEFELLFTPVNYLQKYTPDNEVAQRIHSFEIGSDWDGKESIFRNYGGILGAWDDPVAALRLNPGKTGEVIIIWDNPTEKRVATHTVKVESGWFVTFHKPKFERPIPPGVWNCRVELTDGTAVMETRFLVVPLTHEHMKLMENPRTVNAARMRDASNAKSRAVIEWEESVQKTGESLEQWLDELVGDFWKIEGICRTHADRDSCRYIQECAGAEWSTFSPDPKSELGEVKKNGRIR